MDIVKLLVRLLFLRGYFHSEIQSSISFSGVTIRFGHAWDEGRKEIPDIEEATLEKASARLEKELNELAVGLIPGVSA